VLRILPQTRFDSSISLFLRFHRAVENSILP